MSSNAQEETRRPIIFVEFAEDTQIECDEDFPKDKAKTLLMTFLFMFSGLLNTIVLSYIHEKVPTGPPLPDIAFSNFTYYEKGLQICEFFMMISFIFTIILIVFQRHRWIVFRRLVTIAAILYFIRCFTLLATQVPMADPNFICVEKLGENGTVWNITYRGIKQLFSLGLNVELNEKAPSLCGDYIYSGHTIILTISALFINEYSPPKLWILHYIAWIFCWIGIFFLVISRGHYTIDVIMSYYLSTRIFWSYHTLADNPDSRKSKKNHLKKEFWYKLFEYLENRICVSIPYFFESPFALGYMKNLYERKATPRIFFTNR